MALSSVVSAMSQASGIGARLREMAAHWLERYQSQDCLEQWLWGDVELPSIVYKYIPVELVYRGAPKSLRATQLRALNDVMECNVETRGIGDGDTLGYLRLLREKLRSHLGVEVPWYDLLIEARVHASPRLSPFIQTYLNDLVGVVSFSKDPLVPTMWAHYAQNTGIAVGYSTRALKALGYELRPVLYSELAPAYEPLKDDTIRLDLPDREAMDRDLKAGRARDGIPIQTTVDLARFGADWKSLSRLLLVKDMSWEYESEIRLLVDAGNARNVDTGIRTAGLYGYSTCRLMRSRRSGERPIRETPSLTSHRGSWWLEGTVDSALFRTWVQDAEDLWIASLRLSSGHAKGLVGSHVCDPSPGVVFCITTSV